MILLERSWTNLAQLKDCLIFVFAQLTSIRFLLWTTDVQMPVEVCISLAKLETLKELRLSLWSKAVHDGECLTRALTATLRGHVGSNFALLRHSTTLGLLQGPRRAPHSLEPDSTHQEDFQRSRAVRVDLHCNRRTCACTPSLQRGS